MFISCLYKLPMSLVTMNSCLFTFFLLIKGNKIKIVTIGGSVTSGQGSSDAPNWPQWLQNYLEDNYGGPEAVQGRWFIAHGCLVWGEVCTGAGIMGVSVDAGSSWQ